MQEEKKESNQDEEKETHFVSLQFLTNLIDFVYNLFINHLVEGELPGKILSSSLFKWISDTIRLSLGVSRKTNKNDEKDEETRILAISGAILSVVYYNATLIDKLDGDKDLDEHIEDDGTCVRLSREKYKLLRMAKTSLDFQKRARKIWEQWMSRNLKCFKVGKYKLNRDLLNRTISIGELKSLIAEFVSRTKGF